MSHSIDIKSCLIGGLLVLVIVLCIGAAVYVPSEQFGRFKIEASQEYALVLDSATGQVWTWTVFYASNVDNKDISSFLGPKLP
jgi:hypothetical protein